MNVLAKINAEVASRDNTVSPACQVIYLGPDPPAEGPSIATELYTNGQDVPSNADLYIRMNISGVDLLDFSRSARQAFERSLAEHQASKSDSTSRP